MESNDVLARIRVHLLALQHGAGTDGDKTTELELAQRRLTRLEQSLADVVRPGAPSSSLKHRRELRRAVAQYAGYPAAFVARAECLEEDIVRDVRRAMRTTAEHGVPQGRPLTARPT